jgi:hypothetical protein
MKRVVGILLFLSVNLVVCSLPDDILYFGRFSQGVDRVADWAGSRISFFVSMSNSSASVSLTPHVYSDSNFYIAIHVDCVFINNHLIDNGGSPINISLPASDRQHEISITKLSEPSYGKMAFKSLTISNGTILSVGDRNSCFARTLHLLAIGSSTTAGYGVDGTLPCSPATILQTHNVLHSYAIILASNIGADAHVIALSAKGVVRNFKEKSTSSPDPFPSYYNRTIATSSDPSLYWIPSASYIPHVVLVSLGKNDYSTQPHPTDKEFKTGFTRFLSQIQSDYPKAIIIVLGESHPHGKQLMNIRNVTHTLGLLFHRLPNDATLPYGCDYHPSRKGQHFIAEKLTPIVRKAISTLKSL